MPLCRYAVMNDKNNFTPRNGGPLFYPVDPEKGFDGGGGRTSRRKFLKRTGGATFASFLAWQSTSLDARAGEQDSSDESDADNKWILVCTSDPWNDARKATDDNLHGGELEVRLTATAGPKKGDLGGGNISSGASASEDHNVLGAGSFATIATVVQSVSMKGDANGDVRPTVQFTPPKHDKNAEGVEFSFDENGAPNGGPEPDLKLRLILENGCLLAAATWKGNAVDVKVTLGKKNGEVEFSFELDGSMSASVSNMWTFSVMSKQEYDAWLLLNPPPVE